MEKKMKNFSRTLLSSISAVLFVFLITRFSYAYTVDGDVSDWGIDLSASGAQNSGYLDTHLPSGGKDIDYITEDNADIYSPFPFYVGPGYTTGNYYDAEAMYFDNSGGKGYVAIITGLPPEGYPNGSAPDGMWNPGDIAIDFGTGGEYGYEYGIDIVTGNIYSNVNWDDVYYGGHSAANPWSIIDGTHIGNADVVYSSTAMSGHYVIEASFYLWVLGLYDDDSFGIHWTMECGNDELDLIADVSSVPEPGTVFLSGIGLIGLAVLGRKKLFPGAH